MSALTSKGSTRRWRRTRKALLDRKGTRCAAERDGHVCGAFANTAGHRKRREHGGTDHSTNLEPQCEQCNYGEVTTDPPDGPPRMSTQRALIARTMDAAGLPTTAGRRRALDALATAHPGVRWRSADVDAACRWRRWRGPLCRL